MSFPWVFCTPYIISLAGNRFISIQCCPSIWIMGTISSFFSKQNSPCVLIAARQASSSTVSACSFVSCGVGLIYKSHLLLFQYVLSCFSHPISVEPKRCPVRSHSKRTDQSQELQTTTWEYSHRPNHSGHGKSMLMGKVLTNERASNEMTDIVFVSIDKVWVLWINPSVPAVISS